MAEKLVEELYITETLDEVKKSFIAIHLRKYFSLVTMSIVFFVFSFFIDSSFGTTFWICIIISILEIVWYVISVFSSTNRVMKQYVKLEPKPTRVRIYDKSIEIYIESNGEPIDNKVYYDDLNKIIYNENKQCFVLVRRRNNFTLKKSDLSSESYEFLMTKLKG